MFLKNKVCGCSSVVEHELPKLAARVQFPSPAKRILPFAFLVFTLIGCATVPYQGPPTVEIPKITAGIYHEVHRGDTLWRIAKTYGIDLSDIVRANRLSDATKISPGQQIFIPGAKTALTVTSEKLRLYEKDYFIWPVEGEIISFFGQKSYGVRNKGIDIKAHNEDKIFASKGGKVVFCSDHFKGHGNIVIIDHLDGFFTVYSKNSQNLVKVGDSVEQNQIIALAGSKDRQGAYLHFEIRRYGRPQNPLYYLP